MQAHKALSKEKMFDAIVARSLEEHDPVNTTMEFCSPSLKTKTDDRVRLGYNDIGEKLESGLGRHLKPGAQFTVGHCTPEALGGSHPVISVVLEVLNKPTPTNHPRVSCSVEDVLEHLTKVLRGAYNAVLALIEEKGEVTKKEALKVISAALEEGAHSIQRRLGYNHIRIVALHHNVFQAFDLDTLDKIH